MNPLSVDYSELRRLIAEHLGVLSTTMSAPSFVVTCIAVLAILGRSSCASPTPSTPISTLTPHTKPIETLTEVPASTPAPKPPPTLFPPVMLKEPEDGSCWGCHSDFTLRWSCPYTLPPEACYRVRAKWSNSPIDVSDTYHVQNSVKFSDLSLGQSPGHYEWAVTVVSSTNASEYMPVSEESAWYSFDIITPPVVHNISPTNTVQGTSVPVTITGKNFISPITLTIDESLQATVVDSATITAAIPSTLSADAYPVIVKDSLGQGESHVFFAVQELPPTPVPATPRPVYSEPVLGGLDIHGHDVTFHWSWTGTLGVNDYFALRVGIGYPGESKLWTKDLQAQWRFTEQGDYVWEVAICRGDPAEGDCSGDKQIVVSDRCTFWFTPPPPPKDTPKPP